MKGVYAYLKGIGIIVLAGVSLQEGNVLAQGIIEKSAASQYYQPVGEDIVKVNGQRRFNRALYGTNTAFRVEAGDLPEFALYLPGMGGAFRLGLQRGDSSKWLINARSIKAIYRPGSMLYEIRDPMLEEGVLLITVLPMADDEGMLVRTSYRDIPKNIKLCIAYGGVTGKKFSRDGDIGADPESLFYLQPEYCKGNSIQLAANRFKLTYAGEKGIEGIFPSGTALHIADAARQTTPAAFIQSEGKELPAVAGWINISNEQVHYFAVGKTSAAVTALTDLPKAFAKAEQQRLLLAKRIKVQTPDPYINTLGGALSLAADGIWESPTYMHGAVAWRMRLPAWRGPYVADPLGWHDRARTHYSSYALSQVTTPAVGPVVADTALHLARQQEKMGTALFSSGYICRNPNGDLRPHHYDMNLVYIDGLLRHFNWTGDTAYVKQMWPVLQRHLAWEKRNFDRDDDGLYDAYCCIWASDALQYSGGGVTHSSAYNYFANRSAAQLAALIGEDAKPYQQEADKIYKALQTIAWMPANGWYAEYKDALGDRLLHPAAALWSIYHAIDSRVPDEFQAYQSLRYIDTRIPHIPIPSLIPGDSSAYLLSTTNWQPYSWSLNNVVLAENLHTALAYWQGKRPDAAFTLWRSALLESMYQGSSPGGFEQLSAYDAIRGELYRDFGDPIGMAARSLVEGLFGVTPDALHDTLHIHPGLPAAWDHAALQTPDLQFSYQRKGLTDAYSITPAFRKRLHLHLQLNARAAAVQSVLVNGKPVRWQPVTQVGQPAIDLQVPAADKYTVVVTWKGVALDSLVYAKNILLHQEAEWRTTTATIQQVYDPQQVIENSDLQPGLLKGMVRGAGNKTFFVLLRQGAMQWWQPVDLTIKAPVSLSSPFTLHNNTSTAVKGTLSVNGGSAQSYSGKVTIPAGNAFSPVLPIPYVAGTNSIRFVADDGYKLDTSIINWDVKLAGKTEPVLLASLFNDKLTNIFKNQYLSPRPVSPTLQLPTQGIGDWCYPLIQAVIDDSGLRTAAAGSNTFTTPQGISFATPSDSTQKNILFTSRWDNYPEQATVPLTGKAKHAYLLMAGSTNAMQSQLLNGMVTVRYKDGSSAILPLRNPDNWCPIEQDYLEEGPAFHLPAVRPLRVYLKTGAVQTELKKYQTIKGYSNRAIDGGAATILDLALDQQKELESLTLQTIANDVVIGLMAVSLVR
jgi:hypothetical protein